MDLIHYALLTEIHPQPVWAPFAICAPAPGEYITMTTDPWKITCLPCLKAGRFERHPRGADGRFIATARAGMK